MRNCDSDEWLLSHRANTFGRPSVCRFWVKFGHFATVFRQSHGTRTPGKLVPRDIGVSVTAAGYRPRYESEEEVERKWMSDFNVANRTKKVERTFLNRPDVTT